MALFIVIAIMNACGVDIPKETESSFETMVVDTTDIESPMKFSAKMKGRADVTISPQAAVEKHGYYHRQVAVLKDAYKGTHELMDNGKASYLEVLTAQETLLNAQLNEATNMYNGAMGIIALYIALGGATR